MATTLQKIAGFLTHQNLRFQTNEERSHILTGFKTDNYRDIQGRQGVLLVIQLQENGEYLEIFAPLLYRYADGAHKEAVLQTCLMVSWKTKLVQFEYDQKTGEIRAVIEFPLEDAELTERQLMRCVRGIAEIVDRYDPVIRKAMETGEIEFPKEESPAEILAAFAEFLRRRRAAQGGGQPPSGGLQIEE